MASPFSRLSGGEHRAIRGTIADQNQSSDIGLTVQLSKTILVAIAVLFTIGYTIDYNSELDLL
jgi:hypothetical protein